MGWAGTTLSRGQWAQLIAEEAKAMHLHMTPRQLAEGLGVREAEGDTEEGEHIGPWEESSAFGSTKQRLDYRASTRAALQNWAANGKSWWTAWGNFEKGETEGPGPTRYKRHLGVATAALRGTSSAPSAAETHPGVVRAQASPPPAESSSSSSIGGDLMHLGLVAALVLGGAAMIGLGATRMLGTAQQRRTG